MNDDGRLIDAALRNVPLPRAWPAGLQPEALFADEQLDHLLLAVAVPADLGARIRAGLDVQPTRHRDGTVDLLSLGKPAPLPPQPASSLDRWFTGIPRLAREVSSVAAALALVGLVALAGIEFSRRLEAPRGGAGRPELAAAVGGPAARGPAVRAAEPMVADRRLEADETGEPDRLVTALAGPKFPALAPPAAALPDPVLDLAESGLAELFLAESPELTDKLAVRGAAVGQDGRTKPLGPPAMATVEIPTPARRRVPRLPGYDLAFEMTYGEQPFIDPAASSALAVDRPPLGLGTAGYEAFVAGRARGRGRIRADEVLAAMPAANQAASIDRPTRLEVRAVRSRWEAGDEPSLLVEVALSAGRLEREPSAGALDATLVLDQAAAGDPGAWPRICRGVAALAANLGPDDRVTVVLCGPRARVAARAVNAEQLAALAADWEWQAAAASSDLDAGMALAGRSGRVVVVAHAVSLERVRGEAREAFTAWHVALAAAGGDTLASSPSGGRRFIVLDAAAAAPASRSEPDFGRTSCDAVAIRRAILRQVSGRETLTAADCRLDVRFDPATVARYRLIGHRQSAVESLAAGSVGSTDLHAGETVRVVYEVVPRSGLSQGLVTATASWQASGRGPHQLEARGPTAAADLGPGLPSPHGCELLLAVGLGELAAGSAHIQRPTARVTALEALVDQWRGRGDITPYGAALAHGFEQVRGGQRGAW
jgi:hypothetical protein